MKRVLQLSPRLPLPLDDGGRIATWNLSRCLHHNGAKIDLVCFVRAQGAGGEHRHELSGVFDCVSTAIKDVERQHPVDLAHALVTGSSYFTRKYFDDGLAGRVRDRLTARRYEVTLIDSAFMGVYLPVVLAQGDRGGKIVLRQHNVEHELLDRLAHGASNPLYRILLQREARLFRKYELGLVEQVDDVRMISPRDKEVLEATGVSATIDLIAPFIDVERYACDDGEETEPHSLVCIGNMAWMPNTNGVQWFCEQVWPRVQATHPDAKFYIVGKNPPASVRRLAGENVIVTGYVVDERPHFRRAHLFIVPLLEGSGIRIKILTAMSMGKDVLSTSVGAEGIDFSGLILRDGADEWAAAILEHFEKKPVVREDASKFVAEHYSWRRAFEL